MADLEYTTRTITIIEGQDKTDETLYTTAGNTQAVDMTLLRVIPGEQGGTILKYQVTTVHLAA